MAMRWRWPPLKRAALLTHQGVVAFGQFADEVVRAGQLRHAHHGFDGGGRVGDGDVLAHAAVEQQVLLQHHAHLAAQLRGVDQADVDAVHQQAALLGHVQALHQLGQGAFAGAGAADDADDFAGAHVQADAVRAPARPRAGSGR